MATNSEIHAAADEMECLTCGDYEHVDYINLADQRCRLCKKGEAEALYYDAWHLVYELECTLDAAIDHGNDERAKRCYALLPKARERMNRRDHGRNRLANQLRGHCP